MSLSLLLEAWLNRDQIVNHAKNVGDAWVECFNEGKFPSAPLINPFNGELATCNTNLIEIFFDRQNDNPSQQDKKQKEEDAEEDLDEDVKEETKDRPIPPPPPTKQPPVVIGPDDDGGGGDDPIKPKPAPDNRRPRTPPTIPPRRLPPALDFTQGENLSVLIRPTLSVESSATDRVYNCMLHNPVTDKPAIFNICSPNTGSAEGKRKRQAAEFIIYQIEKIKGSEITKEPSEEDTEFGEEEVEDLTEGLAKNFGLNYLPNTGLSIVEGTTEVLDFGGAAIDKIVNQFRISSRNAFQNVDGAGHLTVEFVDCNDNREVPPDLPSSGGKEITRYPSFPGSANVGDGCFVPVSRFKNNEPPSYGMKTQLQVIYKQKIEGKLYEKQLTIPSPLPVDEIDDNDIKNVFPDELEFGELKAETKIIPYGYLKFYATEKEQADNLFDDIINNLVNGQEAETDNSGQSPRKFSQRSRSFVTGTFNLDRAFYFDFNVGDGEPPVCKRFDLST